MLRIEACMVNFSRSVPNYMTSSDDDFYAPYLTDGKYYRVNKCKRVLLMASL